MIAYIAAVAMILAAIIQVLPSFSERVLDRNKNPGGATYQDGASNIRDVDGEVTIVIPDSYLKEKVESQEKEIKELIVEKTNLVHRITQSESKITNNLYVDAEYPIEEVKTPHNKVLNKGNINEHFVVESTEKYKPETKNKDASELSKENTIIEFPGNPFILCGYKNFTVKSKSMENGSRGVRFYSDDRSIPTSIRNVRGYERVIPIGTYKSILPGCSVKAEILSNGNRISLTYRLE